VRADVKKVKDEYENLSATASVTKRYWDQVEHARKYFMDELQVSLFRFIHRRL
jgi:hypothetical protein